MRGCGVRANTVMRVGGVHLGGVGMAGVTTALSTVSVGGVSAVSVPSVAVVSNVREAADRHRGEASCTQREGEPIDVHTTEYYAPNDRLVTGVLPG